MIGNNFLLGYNGSASRSAAMTAKSAFQLKSKPIAFSKLASAKFDFPFDLPSKTLSESAKYVANMDTDFGSLSHNVCSMVPVFNKQCLPFQHMDKFTQIFLRINF